MPICKILLKLWPNTIVTNDKKKSRCLDEGTPLKTVRNKDNRISKLLFLFLRNLWQFLHTKQAVSCEMLSAKEQNDQLYQKMKPSVSEKLNCLEKNYTVVFKSLRGLPW